jgi:F-type H+-transporting ATPase subunit b
MSVDAPIRTSRRRAAVLGSVAVASCLPSAALAAGGGLDLTPDPIVLGTNLVILGLLIYPVNKLLLQPIVRVLQAREARTSGAQERAGEITQQASALVTQIEARLLEARREAQAQRAAILAKAEEEDRRVLTAARDETARTLDAVRGSVAEELERARASLRDEVISLSREAAARVLGRNL